MYPSSTNRIQHNNKLAFSWSISFIPMSPNWVCFHYTYMHLSSCLGLKCNRLWAGTSPCIMHILGQSWVSFFNITSSFENSYTLNIEKFDVENLRWNWFLKILLSHSNLLGLWSNLEQDKGNKPRVKFRHPLIRTHSQKFVKLQRKKPQHLQADFHL